MVHWWGLVLSGPNLSELDNSEQFVATIFYSPTEITSDSKHKRLAQRIHRFILALLSVGPSFPLAIMCLDR